MKTKTMYLIAILACVLVAGWMAPGARSQDDVKAAADANDVSEAEANAAYQAQMDKDKTGTNPLNFTFDARIYNEYQWLNAPTDGYRNITTFQLQVPFADNKWQFRIKARAKKLSSGPIDVKGFGDTDIRFMTIPYMDANNFIGALATGIEFFLPTATEDALGSGAFSAGPFVFLGILNPWGKGSLIIPGYQQIFSMDREDGRSPVCQGLIDFFVVQTFGDGQFWAYIDPQILLDYYGHNYFMLLECQVGAMLDSLLGTTGHSLYAMPSFGIGHDRPYDVSLEAGYKIVW
jgi:hypothetical protein